MTGRIVSPVLLGSMLLAAVAKGATTPERAPIRLVPKPADGAPETRARAQPTVPENVKEIPFDETNSPPSLTAEERERGYLLFQRPITEPVYPSTRPLPHERLEDLVAFATPGEFEPVTFALYPVRALRNLSTTSQKLVPLRPTVRSPSLRTAR